MSLCKWPGTPLAPSLEIFLRRMPWARSSTAAAATDWTISKVMRPQAHFSIKSLASFSSPGDQARRHASIALSIETFIVKQEVIEGDTPMFGLFELVMPRDAWPVLLSSSRQGHHSHLSRHGFSHGLMSRTSHNAKLEWSFLSLQKSGLQKPLSRKYLESAA